MAVEFADLCVSTDGEKLHIVSGVSGCVSIWDGQLVGVGVAGVWGNLGNLGYVLSHQQIVFTEPVPKPHQVSKV